MHPEIVLSAIPMALSMPAWEADDYDAVGEILQRGVEQVAAAGADFFICPDNTAHIALERSAQRFPIPGLHIADVVAGEIKKRGFTKAALLGTKWTMNGPVYKNALARHNVERMVPSDEQQHEINRAIFDELCLGNFAEVTTNYFVQSIRDLAGQGADCAILGCTEIPLIINDDNSPLPIFDSTRLLAKRAVQIAVSNDGLRQENGWLR